LRNELFDFVKNICNIKSVTNDELLKACEQYDENLEEDVRQIFGKDLPVFDVELD